MMTNDNARPVLDAVPAPKPFRIDRTGDDSPASTLLGYVKRMTGWRQVVVCVIALLAAALNLVPIELQRRIVDGAIADKSLELLITLCLVYGGVVLVQQSVKFLLRAMQGWLSFSAILYTRQHLLRLHGEAREEDGEGRLVSMIGPEVDKLGGFVGGAISDAVTNTATLLGAVAYMIYVEPVIAAFAIGALVPQLVLAPLMQRRLNWLVEEQVSRRRDLSERLTTLDDRSEQHLLDELGMLYRNRMRFTLVKAVMKALLNLLNAAGPLSVLAVGGYLAIQGEVSVGVIVAFLSGYERITQPARALIAFYREAAQANVQHKMIGEWMCERTEGC